MKDCVWFVIVFGIVLFCCVTIFELVWNSDLPMWLKWFLLR